MLAGRCWARRSWGMPCALGLALCSCASEDNAPGAVTAVESTSVLSPLDHKGHGTKAPTCDDGNPCTVDRRLLLWCVHSPVKAGAACTASSTCGAVGACNGLGWCAPPKDVCDDDNSCTTDRCSYFGWPGWHCVHPRKPDGSKCADGDACTAGDVCSGGACSGAVVTCADGDPCTQDTCNMVSGCVFAPWSGPSCDDADVCTTGDVCAEGECNGEPVTCDDGNVCTDDACDPATGVCEFAVTPGTPSCDDADACSASDACASGVCAGTEIDSNDGDECTVDSCDAALGVMHENAAAGTPCTDGNAANGSEICSASAQCMSPRQSVALAALMGVTDPSILERRLGRGRHPVAASSTGLAVVFVEGLEGGGARVGFASLSAAAELRGVWRSASSPGHADPVVAALSDGSFVMAYTSSGDDSDGLGVTLRRFEAFAQPLGAVVIANETVVLGQRSPDLAWDGATLWVAWEDESKMAATGARRACFRGFDAALQATGGEACETGSMQVNARIGLTAAGGTLARAWRRDVLGGSSVEARWGTQQWSFALVQAPDEWESPTLAELDATHLLLVFTQGFGEQEARVLHSNGAVDDVDNLQGTAAPLRLEPSAAVTPDGAYLAWREPGVATSLLDEVVVRRLGWNGMQLDTTGASLPLPHLPQVQEGNQGNPAIAATGAGASGALWAAWNDLRPGQGLAHGDVRVSLVLTPIERPMLVGE